MNQAIRNNADFKSSNTRVIYSPIRNTSEVYLHNNLIAIQSDEGLQVFDGGYQSTTTKSRLNALITEFCMSGECVFQKDFLWYVRKFVGYAKTKDGHKSAVFNVDDFHSGYVFA